MIDPALSSPLLSPSHRHYLTEGELSSRWGLSTKTLSRWRTLNQGPAFSKFGKTIRYPISGTGGILEYEQSILSCSNAQQAMR